MLMESDSPEIHGPLRGLACKNNSFQPIIRWLAFTLQTVVSHIFCKFQYKCTCSLLQWFLFFWQRRIFEFSSQVLPTLHQQRILWKVQPTPEYSTAIWACSHHLNPAFLSRPMVIWGLAARDGKWRLLHFFDCKVVDSILYFCILIIH